MKVHNFFPLSILQDHIKLADDEKLGLINDIRIMKSNSHNSNYQKSDASWTGDTQGYEYIFNNAKFDSYSFNESIGSIATVDCNFSFGVSRNNGMFMSGSFVDGYLLREQDGFILSEQGNRMPL